MPSIWQWSCQYLFLKLRSLAARIPKPNFACEANALTDCATAAVIRLIVKTSKFHLKIAEFVFWLMQITSYLEYHHSCHHSGFILFIAWKTVDLLVGNKKNFLIQHVLLELPPFCTDTVIFVELFLKIFISNFMIKWEFIYVWCISLGNYFVKAPIFTIFCQKWKWKGQKICFKIWGRDRPLTTGQGRYISALGARHPVSNQLYRPGQNTCISFIQWPLFPNFRQPITKKSVNKISHFVCSAALHNLSLKLSAMVFW